jgi:hypothetical protein
MDDERPTPGTAERRDRPLGHGVVLLVPPRDPTQTIQTAVRDLDADQPADVLIDLRLVDDLPGPVIAMLVGLRDLQRLRRRYLMLFCTSGSPAERSLDRAGLTRQLLIDA